MRRGIAARAGALQDRAGRLSSIVRAEVSVTDPVRVDSSSIFARRAGRIAASVVLLVGAYVMVATAWHTANDRYGYHSVSRLHALPILSFTWGTAAVVAAVVQGVVLMLRPAWQPRRLFAAGLIMPTIAGALVLPITLHALVALALGVTATGFDDWVWWSVIVTGFTHVVFASLCVVRVRRLLDDGPAMPPLRVFGYTVVASCVPFVLLCGIPPVFVALTALPLVPVLGWMQPWVARERAELAAMPGRLPRARLVIRRDA